jgi:hypothetical protein
MIVKTFFLFQVIESYFHSFSFDLKYLYWGGRDFLVAIILSGLFIYIPLSILLLWTVS